MTIISSKSKQKLNNTPLTSLLDTTPTTTHKPLPIASPLPQNAHKSDNTNNTCAVNDSTQQENNVKKANVDKRTNPDSLSNGNTPSEKDNQSSTKTTDKVIISSQTLPTPTNSNETNNTPKQSSSIPGNYSTSDKKINSNKFCVGTPFPPVVIPQAVQQPSSKPSTNSETNIPISSHQVDPSSNNTPTTEGDTTISKQNPSSTKRSDIISSEHLDHSENKTYSNDQTSEDLDQIDDQNSKRRYGRPPNTNENSLIRRLECLMAVEHGRISMSLACQYYCISSRTFYRWLKNKHHLLKLTGYRPQDFAEGGVMDTSKHPLICDNSDHTDVIPACPNQDSPPILRDPLPSFSRIPPKIVDRSMCETNKSDDGSGQTNRNNTEKQNESDIRNKNLKRIQNLRLLARTNPPEQERLKMARATTRMRPLPQKNPPSSKNGANVDSVEDDSSIESQGRSSKRRRTVIEQNNEEDSRSNETPVRNNPHTDRRQVAEPEPISLQLTIKPRDNHQSHSSLQANHPSATLEEPIHAPGEFNRDLVIPLCDDYNNNKARYPVESRGMPRDGYYYRGAPPMNHGIHVSRPVGFHRLEIMHGRRKEVIKWYDGTPVEEIKEAVMLRFGLPSKLRWSLFDKYNEEVLISSHIESGRYTLSVHK